MEPPDPSERAFTASPPASGPTASDPISVPTQAGVTHPVSEKPAEVLRKQTTELVRRWITQRQGSAGEILRSLEAEIGWPARHALAPVLAELRADKTLSVGDHNYLKYTLNAGAINEALANNLPPNSEHQSTVDDLFARSRRYRRSREFAEAVEFVSKFREYSPFNNMLVYAVNPLATYFATASHWKKAFGRTIKDDARPMVILAPHRPVLLVYDIADTEGPPLPQKFRVFTQVSGRLDPAILDRTLRNCERERIQVEQKPMGQLSGGYATSRVNDSRWKMRIRMRENLEPAAAYSVLCHELGHIFLGHVGADADGWWPCRVNLPYAVTELEAEAVAHIVCRRAGVVTHGAEYLSSFAEDGGDLDCVSLDLVSRAASRIESMGQRLLPPRRARPGEEKDLD